MDDLRASRARKIEEVEVEIVFLHAIQATNSSAAEAVSHPASRVTNFAWVQATTSFAHVQDTQVAVQVASSGM